MEFVNTSYSSYFGRLNDKEIENKNPTIEIWKWQNCMFEEKIISTIHDAQKEFESFKEIFQKEFKEFNFKII